MVINLFRLVFGDILPANPSKGVLKSVENHYFVNSYLAAFGSRIRDHILLTDKHLKTPPVDFECKEPKDVPIDVITLPASDVTPSSARMHGKVVNGKQIDVFFVWRTGSSTPPNCSQFANRHDGKGKWNKGDGFSFNKTDLTSGIIIGYRACGKREDGTISEGNPESFVTIFT